MFAAKVQDYIDRNLIHMEDGIDIYPYYDNILCVHIGDAHFRYYWNNMTVSIQKHGKTPDEVKESIYRSICLIVEDEEKHKN